MILLLWNFTAGLCVSYGCLLVVIPHTPYSPSESTRGLLWIFSEKIRGLTTAYNYREQWTCRQWLRVLKKIECAKHWALSACVLAFKEYECQDENSNINIDIKTQSWYLAGLNVWVYEGILDMMTGNMLPGNEPISTLLPTLQPIETHACQMLCTLDSLVPAAAYSVV